MGHKINGIMDNCKRVGAVAVAVVSVSGALTLLVNIYGGQVFASKAELEKIKEYYVTREVYTIDQAANKSDLEDIKKLVWALIDANGLGHKAAAAGVKR